MKLKVKVVVKMNKRINGLAGVSANANESRIFLYVICHFVFFHKLRNKRKEGQTFEFTSENKLLLYQF